MTKYENNGSSSGIVSYKIKSKKIIVEFTGGNRYTYSNKGAGKDNVKQMKILAIEGKGLNSFISRNVKDKYDR